MVFTLPALPYAFDALESISTPVPRRSRHDKHHAAYTNNLNNAIAGTEWEGKSIEEILANG